MSDKPANPRNKNRELLLIAVIVVLVIINGVKWVVDAQKEARIREEMENKEMEMVITYAKLDSISNQLDLKIAEINKLGGEIDMLLATKEQLEQDKIELKMAKNLTKDRYGRIKDKVEGYEILLKQKDKEIVKLKQVNQLLLDENLTLKEKENTLRSQISDLEVVKEKLAEKVSVAAVMRAKEINFTVFNRNEKQKQGEEFRVRDVEKLNIRVRLEENSLVEIGTKRMYLRILEPDGTVLYNLGAGSGTLQFNGKEMFFTASKEFLFDNSGQQISFDFDKGNEFKKGQYMVELYAENALIGQKSFIVK